MYMYYRSNELTKVLNHAYKKKSRSWRDILLNFYFALVKHNVTGFKIIAMNYL